jgi:hypothetical protein
MKTIESSATNERWKKAFSLLFPATSLVATTSFLLTAAWFLLNTLMPTQTDDQILAQKMKVFTISGVVFAVSLIVMAQKSDIPLDPYEPVRETWFGHRMAREGEWKNIPVALVATYSFVVAYGAFVGIVAGPETHLLCIPGFYIVGLCVFYLWHVAAHQLENTELHRVHMLHHQDRFPQSDFYGDLHPEFQSERLARGGKPQTMLCLMNPVRRTADPTSLAHEGPLVVGVFAIVCFAKFVLHTTTATCLLALLGFTLMTFFGNAIHMSFHERDFELEPYAWYRELRALHMIHHMHRKNYAMANIILDALFCSLVLSEN